MLIQLLEMRPLAPKTAMNNVPGDACECIGHSYAMRTDGDEVCTKKIALN